MPKIPPMLVKACKVVGVGAVKLVGYGVVGIVGLNCLQAFIYRNSYPYYNDPTRLPNIIVLNKRKKVKDKDKDKNSTEH